MGFPQIDKLSYDSYAYELNYSMQLVKEVLSRLGESLHENLGAGSIDVVRALNVVIRLDVGKL